MRPYVGTLHPRAGTVRDAWRGAPRRVTPDPRPGPHAAPAPLTGSPTFRALLPEPGVVRQIAWSEFAPFFRGQADEGAAVHGGTLVCRVQVYETLCAQRMPKLAQEISESTGVRAPMARLTAQLAERLDLNDLPPESPQARNLWREPDVALPFERYVRLVHTPREGRRPLPVTVTARPAGLPHVGSGAGIAILRFRQSEGQPPFETPETRRAAGSEAAPEEAIPEKFRRPWEFLTTREEVLMDMAVERRGLGRAWARVRRLASRMGRGPRIWRWRAILSGRDLPEQLWGVRLPSRGYDDPEVRRWAERSLAAAGLDPARWLLEWEIFWRRKGV